jgi:hypothetical protein
MAFMKQALLNDGNSTLSDCMVETLRLMLRAFEGDDLQEALNARGEKRPPVFAPWIQ